MIPADAEFAIKEHFGQSVRINNYRALTGGSINRSFAAELNSGDQLFIKLKAQDKASPGMFEAEAASLGLMSKSNTIGVPETLHADANCLIQILFVESVKKDHWYEDIGHQLALMHQAIQAEQFGFELDNYLGTSVQFNTQSNDWLDFWRNNRLQPQITRLAETLGMRDRLIQQLDRFATRLDFYLADNEEPPVFVHGDLWSGNAAADERGAPVIFDPAGYFASREVEFGMMRLFGGFGEATEYAYQEIWPFQDGSNERIEVYRLYHVLNHLILFGRSYYDSAISTVTDLL